MPQVVIKGLSRARTDALAGPIAHEVAAIIGMRDEQIVVEYNDAPQYRCGKLDESICTILIQWKERPVALRKAISAKLAELILGEGCKSVEVMFTNLRSDEFFEHRAE